MTLSEPLLVTPSARKGPRNGPGPRGAENLNRFRERLVGDVSGVIPSTPVGGFRAATDVEWSLAQRAKPHGLEAGEH